jgi:prepilin-type N-terminal cleavage/methylation domain-containing protein/prepilin-type processing-associated H-X9-DG protein
VQRKNGFTLIELLVVIAIIAILAGILFPVFVQAREKARTSVCLSNCKQIGTAILMYAQDYDEAIVPWLTGGNGQSIQERIWVTRLQPYLKNGNPTQVNGQYQAAGVFTCPSYSDIAHKRASDDPDCNGAGAIGPYLPAKHVFATYGMAWASTTTIGVGTQADPYWRYPGSGVDGYWGKPGFVDVRLPAVVRPAETVIISDGLTWMSGGKRQNEWQQTFGCEAAWMHQEGGNFIFLDGHAKRIARNAERYLKQRADGKWFKQYFTFDME